jgi:hypothetical protein
MGSKLSIPKIIKEMKVHSCFVLVLPHSSIIPDWNPILLNASILIHGSLCIK